MRFGSPFGCGFGDPENHVAFYQYRVVRGNTAIKVRFQPTTGLGDAYFGVYLNSVLVRTVYADEGAITPYYSIRVDPEVTGHSLVILRHGHGPDANLARVARDIDSETSSHATLAWAWGYEVLGADASTDSGYTSNWVITGLSYFQTERVANFPTRGAFTFDLTRSGGNATVVVKRFGTHVFEGTGAVGGAIALTAQDGSDATASVTVSGSATTLTGGRLYVRWPESMIVKRGASPSPTTTVATVSFDQRDATRWFDPAVLSPGTYYYRTQYLSDTGDEGNFSSDKTAVITDPPDPPSNLVYTSGNYTNTVIGFTGSPTSGATYRVYLKQPDGNFIDVANPVATPGAGATSATLPTITGYPGRAYVLVRAIKAGVEEKNGNVLEIEYDAAGAVVVARPNTPTLDTASVDVTTGLTLGVRSLYPTADEAASPDKINLYKRAPGGSYNFSVYDAQATPGSAVNGLRLTTLSYTFSAPGWYYVTAKAATAGGVLSSGQAPEILVYVSDVNMTAPSIELDVARG